ncbi:Crp/Fnr family transcriptional regulator [Rhodoferax sp.]|uniref:Crp/Fnr family transcriptional regulator n=1 Tax=Rhodoferax sp. TaxID=50421 RepID=UPI00277955E1|nr:Crp/Fnr family transcriptional regulator [Rhodoferax sp.]
MSEQKVKKTHAVALVQPRNFKRGECVYAPGDQGQAWCVLSGAVRLDTTDAQGPKFASLALPGDVIGAEALVGGHYAFQARALTPCVLTPWKEPKTSLLGLFAATQRRAADVVALRGGRAADRVARLVRLLGAGLEPALDGSQIVMPRLRDVADITDLTVETVSRVTPGRTGESRGRPRRTPLVRRASAAAALACT